MSRVLMLINHKRVMGKPTPTINVTFDLFKVHLAMILLLSSKISRCSAGIETRSVCRIDIGRQGTSS